MSETTGAGVAGAGLPQGHDVLATGAAWRPWSGRARLVVGALAALSFAISLVVAALLFPYQSVNNDEAVYVFQAKAMLHGELTLPAEPHRDFFKPWMCLSR